MKTVFISGTVVCRDEIDVEVKIREAQRVLGDKLQIEVVSGMFETSAARLQWRRELVIEIIEAGKELYGDVAYSDQMSAWWRDRMGAVGLDLKKEEVLLAVLETISIVRATYEELSLLDPEMMEILDTMTQALIPYCEICGIV